jgi:predicted amidohydrolase YtcJ
MSEKKIINAKIYTVDENQPWAEAVAIKDGKIAAVGSKKEILDFPMGRSEIIDAKGNTVLPGFVDNHCHPTAYTYKANAADLFACTGVEEYQAALKYFYEQNPDIDVIKGVGWFYSDFPTGGPNKEDIDRVISDRPVMIYSGDLHSLWVNSKALEMAQIDSNTPNPYGGEFAKGNNGEPTGYINETPAVKVIESRISSFSVEEYKNGILTFFSHANEAGITTVHDAGILEEKGLPAYKLLMEDEYSVNVFCDCLIAPETITKHEDILPQLNEYRLAENRFFHCNTIKLFLDGVPEANTAVIEKDYLNEPGNKGEPQWKDLNLFNQVCGFADRQRLQIHVHAIGDRAVRYTVDALELAAEQNGKRDSRHMIAHLQLCSEQDVRRMKELGVVVVPTAFWFEKGDLYYHVELFNLGKERADHEYRMKSFLDAGLTVACGSDAPVGIGLPITKVPFAPILAIQQGITRCNVFKDPEDPENVLNPAERATLEDMIRSYTISGAVSNFAEDRIGSITAGKDADLIILDRDIFNIPAAEIYQTNVITTIFNGEIVYQANL